MDRQNNQSIKGLFDEILITEHASITRMKTYFVQETELKNNLPTPVVVSEANNGPLPGSEKAKGAESSGQGTFT